MSSIYTHYMKRARCVHVYYALQTQNTSESDPRSYEATKAGAKKTQKKVIVAHVHVC